MNLKKVLSTSVASLTVLSTLSGSVSTKIYASSTDGKVPILSENDANEEKYCVAIMNGENISSIKFAYNLGVEKEFIVRVACVSNGLSQKSAWDLVKTLNGNVGRVLKNNSKITYKQLKNNKIKAHTFCFTEADVTKINGEATVKGKVREIIAVLSGESNAIKFEPHKLKNFDLDKIVSSINVMKEHQTADDEDPAEGNVAQQQPADETAAGGEDQKENEAAEIEQGQEQNEVAPVIIEDETQSDKESKENETGKEQTPYPYAEMVPSSETYTDCGSLEFFYGAKDSAEGYKFKISTDYFSSNKEKINKLAEIINNPMVGKKLKGGICRYNIDRSPKCYVNFEDKIIEKIFKEAEGLGPKNTKNNQEKASKVCKTIIDVIEQSENYQKEIQEIESEYKAILNLQNVGETKKEQTPYTYAEIVPLSKTYIDYSSLAFFYDANGYKFKISTNYFPSNEEKISKLTEIINNPIVNKKLKGKIIPYDIKRHLCTLCYVHFKDEIIEKICKKAEGLGPGDTQDNQAKALDVCKTIIEVIEQSGDYQKESQKLEDHTPILYPNSDDQSKEGETQEKQTSGVINNESQGNSTGTESTNIIQTTVETKKEAEEDTKNDKPEVIDSADETTDSSQALSTNSTELDQQRETSESTQTTEPVSSIENFNLNSETQNDEVSQNNEGSQSDEESENDDKSEDANKSKGNEQSIEDNNESENSSSTKESKTPGLFRRIWNNIKKFLSKLPLIGKFFK